MTPTPEQLIILDAARNTSSNLLISALAGAAKTTTLVMIAEALAPEPMLCLAFNKRIADEMTERLPGNCNASTLNSLGHRAWSKTIGRNLILAKDKNFGIVKELISKLKPREKDEAYDSLSEILDAVAWGKSMGYVPTGRFPNAKPLMNDEEFFATLDEEPSDLIVRIVIEATLESLGRGLRGEVDFNDQLLLPTVFPAIFPQYPHVLVDEAQDLSALNHAMLRKLAKKRLTAVGDECQAIYAFRGAATDSMGTLRESFEMQEYRLSISFRCPTAIVAEANWRAPHMVSGKDAAGSVTTLDRWTVNDLPDTAAIICRNNAPLFAAALRLLKDGRYPQIVGNDIGKSLLKTLKKLGRESLPQANVMLAIDAWEQSKMKKTRVSQKVKDMAECLRVFARQGPTLADAIAYAEDIMTRKGPIQLMTGHKAKGLEFDNVFILNRTLVNMGEEQDRNLMYVMQTRAKERLMYVEGLGYMALPRGSTTIPAIAQNPLTTA